MKSTILATSLVALCALSSVSAHNPDPLRPRKHYARMLTKKQLAPVRTSTTVVATTRTTGAGTVPVAVPTPKGAFPIYPSGPGFDVPPLNRITAVLEGKPAPTVPIPVAQVPPTATPFAGAPPVPQGILDSSKYPPLDKVPNVNSPEVKEWLKELEGANIPGFAPTKSTICDENPQAAAAAGPGGRCWRTCGGCMRDTDITTCKDKLHQGLTFDDGPSPYTPKLLTYLNSVDVKATFYLVGSRVVSRPEMVQYQHQTGHELAVHTWSHPALTTLTTEQIVAELGWTRKAIKDATGVTPLTMRPPFGDIDDRVRAISMAMGLIPVIWTGVGVENEFDSNDWRVPAGQVKANETVSTFRNVYKTVPKLTTGFITLEHDLYQEAVDLAVGFHIPNALAVTPSLTLEPVNTCQNRPMTNAYLESNKDPQHPAILAGPGRVRVAPTPSTSASPIKTGSGTIPSPTQTAAAVGTGPSVLLALMCGMIATVAGL